MLKEISLSVISWLKEMGLSHHNANVIWEVLIFACALIIVFILDYVLRGILKRIVKAGVKKSKTLWDDVLLEHKFFDRIMHIIPAFLLRMFIPYIFGYTDNFVAFIQSTIFIYIVFVLLRSINAFLAGANAIYKQHPQNEGKSIKPYTQVAFIVAVIVGLILIISSMVGESPTALLTGLGAFTAVLMLVFRDSILGFVGGVQLSTNDMVKIGDWISMPSNNTDGTVVDISLTTVKVQNWDKTIATIPTYDMVSKTFHNWRGMEESGGRRIKRSMNFDIQSVHFCSKELLENLSKVHLVGDYVQKTESEVEAYNKQNNIDNTSPVNGRRQTNIGVFRAYIEAYLKSREDIRKDMTFLVRQMPSADNGVPIEIYVFTSVQAWAEYEAVQADIFDHLFAVTQEFELKLFQNPSGSDFRSIIK